MVESKLKKKRVALKKKGVDKNRVDKNRVALKKNAVSLEKNRVALKNAVSLEKNRLKKNKVALEVESRESLDLKVLKIVENVHIRLRTSLLQQCKPGTTVAMVAEGAMNLIQSMRDEIMSEALAGISHRKE